MKAKSLSQLVAILGFAFTATIANAIPVTYDLTAGGSATINSAIFQTVNVGSTGTGVISSFVRVQNSSGTAEGFNADARPVMPEVNTSPSFTRDLTLSAVPIVNLSGFNYYEFLLDINQQSSDPLLSLDRLEIYTRAAALTAANTYTALTGSGVTLRYSLDGITDSEVLLDYNLNSGSGSGDLRVYIPTAVFGATSDNVYLYSKFGEKGGAYAENDGFEEWAVRDTVTSVPDGGSTVTLLGLALSGIALGRRCLKRK